MSSKQNVQSDLDEIRTLHQELRSVSFNPAAAAAAAGAIPKRPGTSGPQARMVRFRSPGYVNTTDDSLDRDRARPKLPGTPRPERIKEQMLIMPDAKADDSGGSSQSVITGWSSYPKSDDDYLPDVREQSNSYKTVKTEYQSLEEDNHSLKIENNICRSTLADFHRNNVKSTQAYNEISAKLFELGRTYGKSQARNQRLEKCLKEQEKQLLSVTARAQNMQVVKQKLTSMMHEVLGRRNQDKERIIHAVETIFDTSLDVARQQWHHLLENVLVETNKVNRTEEAVKMNKRIKKKKSVSPSAKRGSSDEVWMKYLLPTAFSSPVDNWWMKYVLPTADRSSSHAKSTDSKNENRVKSLIKSWNETYNKTAKKNLTRKFEVDKNPEVEAHRQRGKRGTASSRRDTSNVGAEASLDGLVVDVESTRSWMAEVIEDLYELESGKRMLPQ